MDQDLKRIAARIRGWRDEAGLTLQQLGGRSGVSASTIHKIENLQTVPTIAVLLKVANGLNRRPSELLSDIEMESRTGLLRRAERAHFDFGTRAGAEHLVRMIPRNRLDLWRVILQPGAGAGADGVAWQFQGEVILLCEVGIVGCEVADAAYRLEPGDTLHFDTSVPHCWVAEGGEPATLTIFALLPDRLQGDLMTRMASVTARAPIDGQEVDLRLSPRSAARRASTDIPSD